MAENTKIQWCDHTFNGWIGCTKVAEGCHFCYAEELMANRYKRVQWGPNGTRNRTKTWNDPIKWNRQAKEKGEIRKVFCASLSDVFEDRPELVPWRADLFDLIDKCQNLNWLLLTKRPQNIIGMWPDSNYRNNVWLGTSIANQKNTKDYIPPLLETRRLCKYLFLSVEPQISMVDLSEWLFPKPLVNWVIYGGESKQGKEVPREFHLEWARFGVNQCYQAGVACFVKQFGSNVFENGQRIYFKDSHAGDISEWSDDLKVRECPENYISVIAA